MYLYVFGHTKHRQHNTHKAIDINMHVRCTCMSIGWQRFNTQAHTPAI